MTERRLAAIVATDVVGYSRLIGADEEGTRAAMRKLRDELWDPRTEQHKGRVVKTTGDLQGIVPGSLTPDGTLRREVVY